MNWCRKRRGTKMNEEMERHKEFFRKQNQTHCFDKKPSFSKITPEEKISNSVETEPKRNSYPMIYKRESTDSPIEHQPIIYRSKKETEIAETLKEINRMGDEYGCENSKEIRQVPSKKQKFCRNDDDVVVLSKSCEKVDEEKYRCIALENLDEEEKKEKIVTNEDKNENEIVTNDEKVVQVDENAVAIVCKTDEDL